MNTGDHLHVIQVATQTMIRDKNIHSSTLLTFFTALPLEAIM
jgi:hypothetical protein